MYPIDHFDALHREREEVLRRAEYERLVSQEMFKQRMNQKFHRKVVNWLGVRLVSWGEKLEHLGTIAERHPAPAHAPGPSRVPGAGLRRAHRIARRLAGR